MYAVYYTAKAMRKDIERIYFELLRIKDELAEIDMSLQDVCYTLPPEKAVKEGLAHLALHAAVNEITYAGHFLHGKNRDYQKAIEELQTAHRYLVWAKLIINGEEKKKIEEIDNKLVSTTITLKKII